MLLTLPVVLGLTRTRIEHPQYFKGIIMTLPLFDAVLAGDYSKNSAMALLPRSVRQQIVKGTDEVVSQLKTARPFEISNDALEVMASLMKMSPSEQFNNLELLALPADRVWLEFDLTYFNAIRVSMNLLEKVPTGLGRFGIYAIGKKDDQHAPITLHWFTEQDGHPLCGDTYFGWRSSKPSNFDLTKSTGRARRLASALSLPAEQAHAIFGWGQYAVENLRHGPEVDAMQRLLGISTSYTNGFFTQTVDTGAFASMGTLAFVMAALSLLDHKPVFDFTERPHTARWKTSSGTNRTYSISRETITLRTSVVKSVAAIRKTAMSRKPMIQHEVRDHWSYRRSSIDATCRHEWSATGWKTQQRCEHCGGLRWHRNGFVRGDAAQGIKMVTHTVVR